MSVAEGIVIVGDGETAELAYEYFTHDSPHKVVAFSVERHFLTKTELFGLPVVPLEEAHLLYDPASHKAFVAISYAQLNRLRTRLFVAIKGKGFTCATYVSSRAFVWHNVPIGENCFIMEHNVIQYGASIGNNVTLWSGNHVGHRTAIRDNVFVSSHVVISGYCEIGENCFMGVNSCVADHVTVAKDNLIGIGAVITRNTREREVYRRERSVASRASSFAVFGVKE